MPGTSRYGVIVVRVVAAVDKFRGTANARDVAAAIGHACWSRGIDCDEIALADGGEGLLEALGGPNRTTRVTGPLGSPVEAPWRLHRGTAIIEMALASGLALAGYAEGNDPLGATTAGTGELIDQAISAGAKRIIVGLGGSATTDGGLGALRALSSPHRLGGVQLLIACDVTTRFTEAAAVFGPQKGASPAQVKLLTNRLEQLVQQYRTDYGVDVSTMGGAGAAGGLAGGLAALGGKIVGGFDLVADELNLADAIEGADLVITGEGRLDLQSFEGKVVGGVADLAAEFGVPTAAIVGVADEAARHHMPTYVTAELFGEDRSITEPLWCIEHAALQTSRRPVAPGITRRAWHVALCRRGRYVVAVAAGSVVVVSAVATPGSTRSAASGGCQVCAEHQQHLPTAEFTITRGRTVGRHDHGRDMCRRAPGSGCSRHRALPDWCCRRRSPMLPVHRTTAFAFTGGSAMVNPAVARTDPTRPAEPPWPLALATTTVAPVVTNGGSVTTGTGIVVWLGSINGVVVAPAESTTSPGSVSPPTDEASPPSVIDRRMKKPAITATAASTIASTPLTGGEWSFTRGDRRGIWPEPSYPSLIGSILHVGQRQPLFRRGVRGDGEAGAAEDAARPVGRAPLPRVVR